MPEPLEYVVKGALMKCDKGTLPVEFNPTCNTHVKIKSSLVTNAADKIPVTNIPPFGVCSITKGPCSCAPTAWQDTFPVKVVGHETLMAKSTLPCGLGGKIEFITSGQENLSAEEKAAIKEANSKEDEGWSLWDAVEFIPIVGSVVGIVREAAKGNWGMVAMNVGFLAMDIFAPGSGTGAKVAVKGSLKVAAKTVGKVSGKRAAKAAAKALNKVVNKGRKAVKALKAKIKKLKQRFKKFGKCCPKNKAARLLSSVAGVASTVWSLRPVHFGTGEEVLEQTDMVLDGPIPITWTRTYSSGAECEDWGLLGARWASEYTTSLSIAEQGVVYHDASGRAVALPVLAIGEAYDDRSEGFCLQRDDEHRYRLIWNDGSEDHFASPYAHWLPHGYDSIDVMQTPGAWAPCQRLRLVRTQGRDGRGITIEHFLDAPVNHCLLRLTTDDGRIVEAMRAQRLATPSGRELIGWQAPLPYIGRLDEVRANGERIAHAHYHYALDETISDYRPGVDGQHPCLPLRVNLIAQGDIADAKRAYEYQYHLLTNYSNYNGHQFPLTWSSLQALKARWDDPSLDPDALQQQYPIRVSNSYQARALTSGAADGSEGVIIDYYRMDVTRVHFVGGGTFDYHFNNQWLNTAVYRITEDNQQILQGRQTWDADGMLITSTDPQHNTTRYDYDDAGNLIRTRDASGAETNISYDKNNQPISITNALGHTQQLAYDAQGQLIQATDALGQSTHYHYDAQGQLIRVTDAKGADKHLQYNATGQLSEYRDCSGKRTQYRYDSHQQLSETIDALGQRTRYQYNLRHQLTDIIHGDNSKEHFDYDAEDNLTAYTDASGHRTQYRYNTQDLPIERTDPKGQTVYYHYDGEQRLTKLTNGNGEDYRLVYDDEGQLIQEIGFDGKATDYQYSAAGHLIKTTQGGREVSWQRDSLGRLQRKSTLDGNTRYAYDPLGQLTHILSPHSQHHLEYDPLGQLVTERTAYFVKQALSSAQQNLFEPLPTPDASFTLNHRYDELGERIDTQLPNGRKLSTLRYGSGHWNGLLWNQQPIVDIERDDLHRERSRSLGRGAAPSIQGQRDYDPQSRLSSLTLHSQHHQHSRHYQWNLRGELTDIHDQQGGHTRYQYDPLGQLLSAQHPHEKETFAFDPAGNLLDPSLGPATGTTPATSLADTPRDSSEMSEQPQPGFRPGKTRQVGRVMHNLLTRYLGQQYEYDTQGNTVIKRQVQLDSANDMAELHCVYDGENRLIRTEKRWRQTAEVASHAQVQQSCHYFYDAFGRRIAKQVSDASSQLRAESETAEGKEQLTLFVWDGDTLLQEIQPEQTISYLYEPDSFVPLAQMISEGGTTEAQQRESDHPIPVAENWLGVKLAKQANGEDGHVLVWRREKHRQWRAQQYRQVKASAANDRAYFYACDHLGTPLELLDEQGSVVWSAEYKAWGRIRSLGVNRVAQPLRFQGQYEDSETNLYYNRYRYYDPDSARYLTQDPIKLHGGENFYQYGDNPIAWIDPLGLCKKKKKTSSSLNRLDIAKNAKWRGNSLQKHAYDRHPGLAKGGPNQLPSVELYDQRARQNILDADIVVKRKKGDVLFINSKNGQATSVQQGADCQWFMNSFHLRTSAQIPNELK